MTYSVSTTDIESRWRPLSDIEADVATTLIDDAIVLLDSARRSLATAVEQGLVPERLVVMTVAETVIRVLSNPDRLSQQTVSAEGSVSTGWQFDSRIPAPRLRLSDLDLATLDTALAAAGFSTGKTGSLLMRNSQRWPYYVGDAAEPVLPFPYTYSDRSSISDNYILVVQ